MFSYEPITEEEAMQERFSLLPQGEYDAVVRSAVAKTSSTGNSMAVVEFDVYDENGSVKQITDYLVFTKKMMWKVILFCKSANIEKIYMDGLLSPQSMLNRNVKVFVEIQQGSEIPVDKLNGKPVGSKYPEKNIIASYIDRNDKSANQDENIFDNDLPF